jgi:hypothetical protein
VIVLEGRALGSRSGDENEAHIREISDLIKEIQS